MSKEFEFLLPQNIRFVIESEMVKFCYDYILFYNDDVTTDLIRQVTLLIKFIDQSKMKTINELSFFLVENYLSSFYSEV